MNSTSCSVFVHIIAYCCVHAAVRINAAHLDVMQNSLRDPNLFLQYGRCLHRATGFTVQPERASGWSDGTTIAHELMRKSGLPVLGSSSLSHAPISNQATRFWRNRSTARYTSSCTSGHQGQAAQEAEERHNPHE